MSATKYYTVDIERNIESICVVSLTDNYKSYDRNSVITLYSVEDLDNYLKHKEGITCSTFEQLSNDVIKIFLDLEHIPFEYENMYKEIIENFIKYAGIPKTVPYVVTINRGSKHVGLSYHVIFSIVTTKHNLKNLVLHFKNDFEQYRAYIDSGIYTRNRLFRLPHQLGIHDSKVKKLPEGYNKYKDVHKILESCNVSDEDKFTKWLELATIQAVKSNYCISYNRVWVVPANAKQSETKSSNNFENGIIKYFRNTYKMIMSMLVHNGYK